MKKIFTLFTVIIASLQLMATAEVTAPVAYDATGVNLQGFTAHWSECPGATSYTLRVQPAPLKGLIFHESFSKCTAEGTTDIGDNMANYCDTTDNSGGWWAWSTYEAPGGIRLDQDAMCGSPNIYIYQFVRKFTLKFKAKPYIDYYTCDLNVTLYANTKSFEISGPEQEYTFEIERSQGNGYSDLYTQFSFQNNAAPVVITDVKIYIGDINEPQNAPSTREQYSWDGYTTFVEGITDTTYTINPNLGKGYWIYDVKAVYPDEQESDWSNTIQVTNEPSWPVFLEDDDNPAVPVPGDVNGDGEVTSADITALYNFILSGDDSRIVNGDQDGDGDVTTHDVTVVYNVMLGVI